MQLSPSSRTCWDLPLLASSMMSSTDAVKYLRGLLVPAAPLPLPLAVPTASSSSELAPVSSTAAWTPTAPNRQSMPGTKKPLQVRPLL